MGSGPQKGKSRNTGRELRRYFRVLLRHFGPQRWWPAKTRLEVILGAILTQNTSWRNAELALGRLRQSGLHRLDRLRQVSQVELAKHIRAAGFFRQKARTIRNFTAWLDCQCGGVLSKLFALPAREARRELLTISGLGPETVDAILLYAGRHPFFVADAYTRRVLERHGLLPTGASYSDAQKLLQRHLPRDHVLYNEFHALLVEVGKRFCRRESPKCEVCPLQPFLPGVLAHRQRRNRGPASPTERGIS